MVTATFKRIGMALLGAILLTAAVGVASAQNVRDVPPSHWAYEAVMELVQRGYLTVEDGRFLGDQPVDRFTLATVVARILHEIETGGVEPQSRQDVELLRQVVTEFREELVSVFARIDQTDARVDTSERGVAVVEEKISEVISVLSDVVADVEALERRLAGELAEQEAMRRAELQAEAVQLQGSLGELRALLEQRIEELSAQQNALRSEVIEMIASLKAESEERMAALEANVRQALADSGIALGGLQESLEADAARLRALEAEVQSLSSDLDELIIGVEQALAGIRSELNAQSEALAAQQLALEEQRGQYGALQERVDALGDMTRRLDSLKAQIDGVERQVLAMQSQIGLSEEQLRALSDRLMDELESQYQHSFLLAGTVSDELKALREEFNSYRQNTERELASARQAQMFGIIGALLGLIGLAN